jgi:hypothetical protein
MQKRGLGASRGEGVGKKKGGLVRMLKMPKLRKKYIEVFWGDAAAMLKEGVLGRSSDRSNPVIIDL